MIYFYKWGDFVRTVKEEISINLLFFRKKAKMTQENLANAIGVKKNTISQWENGVNSIDIEILFEICKILGIGINDMFGEYAIGGNKLNHREIELVDAYRAAPHMQEAVNRILGLEPVAAMQTVEEFATETTPLHLQDMDEVDIAQAIIDKQREADKKFGKRGNTAKSG